MGIDRNTADYIWRGERGGSNLYVYQAKKLIKYVLKVKEGR